MNRLQQIEHQALTALHLSHPYAQEAPMAQTLNQAIYDDIMAAVEHAVSDAIGRWLTDPRHLAHALTDALDGSAMASPAPPLAPLPPAPADPQPGDADQADA